MKIENIKVLKLKKLMKKHIIRNNKNVFNYDFKYKGFLKRNKYNTISFKNNQKMKIKQLRVRKYKLMGKYQIKYI